jgi:hypothetical protein
MITITWVYERPNADHPFYQESSDEARASQQTFDNIREEGGFVKSYNKFSSEDNLSYTAVWVYETIEDFRSYVGAVAAVAADHVTKRNAYVIEHGHKITGTASEDVFLIDGEFTNIRIIG